MTQALGDRVQYLMTGPDLSDDRECFKVPLIGIGTQLGTSCSIRQTSAHWNPGLAALAFAGRSPPDSPAAWVVDGGLDPQYAALLVVHFDRILLDPVFDPGAFHPSFQVCVDFSVKPTADPSLQKTQDVCGIKVLNGVPDKCGVKALQAQIVFKNDIGRVLAFAHRPVI